MAAVEQRPAPERFSVTITYLEQHGISRRRRATPALPIALLPCRRPPVRFYRHLYNTVGEDHKWVSRRYMPDDKLERVIHQPGTELFVLYLDGWPAGFAEFKPGKADGIDIKFFGLIPEARGRGLGAFFFDELLTTIWARSPRVVRIETCSMDSPAALRIYQRAGFSVTGQGAGVIEWLG